MAKIVDIKGLADVLSCSVQTMYKTWKEYPCYYIGLGRTAKSARFNVDDVLAYLMERDYNAIQKHASLRSKTKMLDRGGKKSPQRRRFFALDRFATTLCANISETLTP